MRSVRLGIGWVLLLLMGGCAPVQRIETLSSTALPPDTVMFTLEHLTADCAGVQGEEPDQFIVECADSRAQVVVQAVKRSRCPRPQGVSRRLSVVLAMDQSASLFGSFGYSGSDPDKRRFPAAQSFVERLPADARLALCCFASLNPMQYGDYDLLVPIGEGNHGAVLRALQLLQREGPSPHGTPLWNTLLAQLRTLAQEPAGRERWLVCFSDGANDVPDGIYSHTDSEVEAEARRTRTRLFFVFLGDERSIPNYPTVRATLQRLADATDGALVAVQEARDLQAAFEDVVGSADIAPCYVLHCALKRPGGFRQGERIRLKVRGGASGVERIFELQIGSSRAERL
ncbi:MAG: hypothetical protein ABDI19_11145 [Armatimonadota bacterium]